MHTDLLAPRQRRFEMFSLIPLQAASGTQRYRRYSVHQVFEESFRRKPVAWLLSVQRFIGFLCNAGIHKPCCHILYGRGRTIVEAYLHKRGLSCKESSSTDLLGRASDEEVEVTPSTILAGGYEAQGHVCSLRTAWSLTASKRSAATT